MQTHNLTLFTDASVNSKTGVGYGAYLVVYDLTINADSQREHVKTKRFENTSSTKLELQTLLWALTEMSGLTPALLVNSSVYTDSQNIVGLLARRQDLEQRNYYANSGKRLNNSELYQQFFTLADQCNLQLIKVAGHKTKQTKNEIDLLFELVDRASRAALRKCDSNLNVV